MSVDGYGMGDLNMGFDGVRLFAFPTCCIVLASTEEEARLLAESLADGSVACGWALDAGMREAERNRVWALFVIQSREHKNDERDVLAVERARIAAAIDDEMSLAARGDDTHRALARLRRVVEGG